MKFNKFLSMLSLSVMALALAACSDDEPSLVPGEAVNSDGVYFSVDDDGVVALSNGQQAFTVNLYREKTDGELTVSIAASSTMESLPFTVPASVTFPVGAAVAPIEVGVDFSGVEANVKYPLTLSVSDEVGTPYGLVSKTYTASYEPWSEWKRMSGIGVYTFTQYLTGEADEYVYVRQSLVNPDIYQYQVGSLGMTDVPDSDRLGVAPGAFDVNYILEYDKSTGFVTMNPMSTGYLNTNYNERVMVADVYSYCKYVNPSFAGDIPVESLRGESFFDEETGLFSLNVVYYISLGVFRQGVEYLQLPGYTSYSVRIATNGHYVDESGVESQVLSIAMSESIATARYAVYAGQFDDAEAEAAAAALAADEDAASLTSGGNVSVVLEPGEYTAVVAGVDSEGNMKAFDYVTFTYISVKADPNAGWTSRGQVLYTEDIMASVFTYPQVCSYYLEIQENDETPGVYRLVNPYKEAYPYWEAYQSMSNGADNYLVINAQDPTAVYIETSPMNYSYQGDDMVISCYGYELLLVGKTFDEVRAGGYFGTFADGRITMPAAKKGPIMWVGTEGFYYANGNGAFCVDFNDEEEEASFGVPVAARPSAAAVKAISGNKVGFARRYAVGCPIDSDAWMKFSSRRVLPLM